MPSGLQAGLASLRWSSNIAAAVFGATHPGVHAAVNWGAGELEEELRRDRRRRRRQKVIACCKKVAAFLFSHIGLAGMVVAYSILGGFLFQAVEISRELELKQLIREFKESTIDEIVRLAENYTTSSNSAGVDANFTNFTEQLRQLFTEKYRILKTNGWEAKDFTEEWDIQWSFAGALLYAVTVITTIGYGHIAPKTGWGRFLTILYALVGIPLTFLYLSNIGNFLADCFRLFYKKICCDICCCQECDKKKYRQRLKNRRMQQLLSARKNLHSWHPTDDVIPDVVLNGPTTTTDYSDLTKTVEDDVNWSANYDDEVTSHQSLLDVPSSVRLAEECNESCSSVNSRSDGNDFSKECGQHSGTEVDHSTSPQKLNPISNRSRSWNDLEGYLLNSGGKHANLLEYEDLQETDILMEEGDSIKETCILLDEEEDGESLRETNIVDDEDSVQETDILCDDSSRYFLEYPRSEEDSTLLFQFLHAKESDIFEDFCVSGKLLNGPCKEVTKPEIHEQLEAEIKEKSVAPDCNVVNFVSVQNGQEITPKDLSESAVSRKLAITDKKCPPKEKRHLVKIDKQQDLQKFDAAARSVGENNISIILSEKHSRSRNVQTRKKKGKRKLHQNSEEVAFREELVRANTLPIGRRPKNERKIMVIRHSGTAGGQSRLVTKEFLPTPNGQMDLLSPPRPFQQCLNRNISRESNCSSTSRYKSSDISSVGSLLPDCSSSVAMIVDHGDETTSLNDVTCDAVNLLDLQSDDSGKDPSDVEATVTHNNLKHGEVGDELPIIFLDDAFDYDDNVSDNEEKVTVPVYICLIIIAGYTLSGSCLFAGWEGWDLLTGSYFCFITLSTIGLGDIVPGSDMTEWEKLVLCALWLVMGLSLLAMCFNLMQEEVKEKCKYIGQKLGLLKDEERHV